MDTDMKNQRRANTNTRSRVTNTMVQALHRFIEPKLIEYGWLTTDEDSFDLISNILGKLLSLCHGGNSHRFILETLTNHKTSVSMAQWISYSFLSLNPRPEHKDLLSFTEDVVNFFHDLCEDHFAQGPIPNISSQLVAHGVSSPHTQDNVQTETFPLFRLPSEIRNMIYREVLVVPDGGVVRSFAPPALLQTNKQLRHEASPIFYGQNEFEITIKRLPQDEEIYTAGRSHLSVDMWVWRRFLHMWDDFGCFGANCLKHVRDIVLIYGLNVDEVCLERWGFDSLLGFRLSSSPFEEDCHRICAEDNGEFDKDPEEEDVDPVAVCEIHRGTMKWRRPREVKFHLFQTTCEYGTDEMWDFYPLKRLAHMLWRCVRDCHLASQNIDLICEDLPYWVHNIGRRTRYKPVEFDDSDDGND